MVIWKYELGYGVTTVEIPASAKLLTVQLQAGRPVLWAMCDPRSPKITRYFVQYMTGGQINGIPGDYIATVQYPDGIVGHFFDSTMRNT